MSKIHKVSFRNKDHPQAKVNQSSVGFVVAGRGQVNVDFVFGEATIKSRSKLVGAIRECSDQFLVEESHSGSSVPDGIVREVVSDETIDPVISESVITRSGKATTTRFKKGRK